MKIGISVVILTLSLTASAWCEDRCRTYDYQEMKDMDKQELDKEIEATLKKSLSEMEYGNKMLELGSKREADKLYASGNQCDEQVSRLMKVRSKKYPPAEPAK